MQLARGMLLGPYEIGEPLGAGGMGEVYRARDTRLERTVAIKILPAHLSVDPVRRQRFEREAKTISSLNHPHICVLHDVGSQSGIDYLVMECIEGDTLAKTLAKGPLSVEQVLRFGAEIADALDKAHRSGVVHRDLKPGNIMLTRTGVKLLDFGLAKPAVPLTGLATLTAVVTEDSPITERGAIVGTFQYMSPEQVEAKDLDGRSDIFSLGAVLYEMLTGKKAFDGKSQLSVASAILEKEPASISGIKPLAPPSLGHAIRRCLAKDPDDRWQTARDLALELKWIGEEGAQAGGATWVRSKHNRERLAWILVAIFMAASAAALIAFIRARKTPSPVTVADITSPKGTQFAFVVNGPPALSPDGHNLVFSARDASGKSLLWIRSFDGSPLRSIPGTDDAYWPFWSADGESIGFFAHHKLQTIGVSSARLTTVCETVRVIGNGGTWNRAGTILFADGDGIFQVSAAGGSAVPVIRRDASKFSSVSKPSFLPDGEHFLYVAGNPGSPGDTYLASLDGKVNRPLLQGGRNAVYASGLLVYTRDAALVAAPFDVRTGTLTGGAWPIVEPVAGAAFTTVFDVSQNGVLVFEPSSVVTGETQLAWFDRSGKRQSFVGSPAVYYDLRLSHDGRRLAFSVGNPKSEIWVDDLVRGARMRLTFDPDTDKGVPVWSADGNRILFSTLRGSKARVGIYEKAANGAGTEELLLPSEKPDQEAWATDWSPDGRFVLFCRGDMFNTREAEIWVLPLSPRKKPSIFVRANAAFDPQFSPDGKWVAYTSTESGSPQVYVVPFEASKILSESSGNGAPSGKWQISNDGGSVPRWRRDGKELFYVGAENTLMAVDVETKGTAFEAGRAKPLFTAPLNPFAVTYDVSPDGTRFVVPVASGVENLPLTVMFNWPSKFRGQ